jgi:UMF1 family MFS transporter
MQRWLERAGLGRPQARAWALYDWANSAVVCSVVTALFPVYWREIVCAGRADAVGSFSRLTTITMLAMALLGPLLGAVSDVARNKRALLATCVAIGSAGTAALFFVGPQDRALAQGAFAAVNVGLVGGFVFYDALLCSVASAEEYDRLSSSAYALGYLGGGLLLALHLAWIQRPEWFGLPSGAALTNAQRTLPVRLAFLSAAAWWVLFSLPLLARAREAEAAQDAGARTSRSGWSARAAAALAGGWARSLTTLRELWRLPQAARFLAAYLLYSEGIGTIIRMATIYGSEIGIETADMVGAVLLVQLAGVPCSFLLGGLAGRLGPKRVVLAGLVVYALAAVFAARMRSAADFYLLALAIALVQGGTQALSRSLWATLIPPGRTGEFFGLYGVFDRFAGALGPALFAAVLAWSGSSRSAVAALLALFLGGALVLAWVDVPAGRRQALGER